jgi:hypothetical protein
MAELPTGTVTFLFTDVEGSTAQTGVRAAAQQHRPVYRLNATGVTSVDSAFIGPTTGLRDS